MRWTSSEALLGIANVTYLIAAAIAVAASLAVVLLSNRVGKEKDRELIAYQASQSTITASLNKDIASAQAKAAIATERAAVAEKQAAEAELRSNEARLALARFAAPRRLTEQQQAIIVQFLKPYAGTPFVFSVQTSGESVAFMEQLGAVLERAGWVRKPHDSAVPFTTPGKPPAGIVSFSGIAIYYDTAQMAQLDLPTRALFACLKNMDLHVESKRIIDGSDEIKDAIHILVGEKPRNVHQ